MKRNSWPYLEAVKLKEYLGENLPEIVNFQCGYGPSG